MKREALTSSPGRRARTALLGVLLALLPGCFAARSTFNEPLAPERLATLKPGVTTARQVVETLGAPAEVVQLARRSAYRYEFSVTKRAGLVLIVVFLLNEDTRADRAWLFFDENDVLTHFGSTFDAERTEYALPWEDVHEADCDDCDDCDDVADCDDCPNTAGSDPDRRDGCPLPNGG